MIKINGVSIPELAGYKVAYQKITEGERDSSGTMHLDLVARKKKLILQWKTLTQSQAIELLGKFDELLEFSCTYFDPKTGTDQNIQAYCGDPVIGMLYFNQGDPIYKDFEVSIIEL